MPSGKTGARTVILQPEAVNFFARLAGARPKKEPLVPRADGSAWGAGHQVRPMKRALVSAGLDPSGTFYALRHSYRGVPRHGSPAPELRTGFSLAFLIRMLFSCLVDADSIATDGFYAALESRTVQSSRSTQKGLSRKKLQRPFHVAE